MSLLQREPRVEAAAHVHELAGSPPNPHRVHAHRGDVVWIACGDPRAGIVEAGARESAGLASFVAGALRAGRWAALVERLGLDFTMAASLAGVPQIFCTRGPAARVPLYLACGTGRPALTTRLWADDVPHRPRLSFLRHVLATAYLPSPSEPDHTLETASPWRLRTPRGVVLGWREGHASVLGRYDHLPAGPAVNEETAHARLRDAVDARIRALAGDRRLATELSGGIDSGIVAARAAALLPGQFAGGITLVAPYHELRREQTFVAATLSHARAETRRVAIEDHLPFAGLGDLPLHDEPSMSSLAASLLAGVFSAARELGAEVLCHGIGGDQVFADRNPSRFAALSGWRDGLCFAGGGVRLGARAARRQLRRLYFGGPRCLRRSPAFLLHDGWYDRYLAPASGVRYESVFVDLEILRLCDALRSQERAGDPEIPKSLPRRVFACELAPTVAARRGKAGFDGVHQRGLRRNIDDICRLVDCEARPLAEAGIDAARLIRRLRFCASRGWGSGDTPVFAALAWVAWIHSLQKERDMPPGASR
jgi:hypothetical protein